MNEAEVKTEKTDAHKTRMITIRAEVWHELLEIAGAQIDPATAEVVWEWGQLGDPYGLSPDPPPEGECVGRLYWARAPGTNIWINFCHLTEETCAELRQKLDRGDYDDPSLPF